MPAPKTKKRLRIICIIAAAAMLFAGWALWGNTALTVTELTCTSTRLPAAFDGYRIVQISDLHNSEFGEGNTRLLAAVKEAAPHSIVLTGDLVDCRKTDIPTALAFAREACKLAPTYYITGNHEGNLPADALQELLAGLTAAGVTVLRDAAVPLVQGEDTVWLLGAEDPAFADADAEPAMLLSLQQAWEDAAAQGMAEDDFTVLLAHRPELFAVYQQYGADLTLSGHAHGGQFRLPLLGGLFAPGQGLLPAYDAGLYEENGCRLAVSRGLGNSVFPLRLNNRPELVVLTLQAE